MEYKHFLTESSQDMMAQNPNLNHWLCLELVHSFDSLLDFAVEHRALQYVNLQLDSLKSIQKKEEINKLLLCWQIRKLMSILRPCCPKQQSALLFKFIQNYSQSSCSSMKFNFTLTGHYLSVDELSSLNALCIHKNRNLQD